MSWEHLSNVEVAKKLSQGMREWRVSEDGAALSQALLSETSGVGLTPLKRFEKTGAITLRNFVAIMRGLGLIDRLESLIPSPEPGPLAILEAESKKKTRVRSPRRVKTKE